MSERDSERVRDIERDRERETESEKQRERKRERERARDRERETESERERQRGRERERGGRWPRSPLRSSPTTRSSSLPDKVEASSRKGLSKEEIISLELMTSDRKLKSSTEFSKGGIYGT